MNYSEDVCRGASVTSYEERWTCRVSVYTRQVEDDAVHGDRLGATVLIRETLLHCVTGPLQCNGGRTFYDVEFVCWQRSRLKGLAELQAAGLTETVIEAQLATIL